MASFIWCEVRGAIFLGGCIIIVGLGLDKVIKWGIIYRIFKVCKKGRILPGLGE